MSVKEGPSCPGCGLPNYEGLCPHCRGDQDAYEHELVPPFPTTMASDPEEGSSKPPESVCTACLQPERHEHHRKHGRSWGPPYHPFYAPGPRRCIECGEPWPCEATWRRVKDGVPHRLGLAAMSRGSSKPGQRSENDEPRREAEKP